MKIAIIGGGIAGMTAAYLLNQDHDITLFEANDYVGGHTHTHDVKVGGTTYAVDTGFIVFNETTYPNFVTLIKRLGVEYQPSSMTFSVKCERTGLEYSPHSLKTFFAQRRNILDPFFYRMILDIIRSGATSTACSKRIAKRNWDHTSESTVILSGSSTTSSYRSVHLFGRPIPGRFMTFHCRAS